MPVFKITKKFTAGALTGLEVVEITTVSFPVGFKCKRPIGGSAYEVTSCVEVTSSANIETLNEWIDELQKEQNHDAWIAFTIALRAVAGVGVSPSSARVALPVIEEHLNDAKRDENVALVAALTEGVEKLNEVSL